MTRRKQKERKVHLLALFPPIKINPNTRNNPERGVLKLIPSNRVDFDGSLSGRREGALGMLHSWMVVESR